MRFRNLYGLAIAALLIAGCSGGAGTSLGPPAPGGGNSGGTQSSASDAQAEAQAALDPVQNAEDSADFSSGVTAQPLSAGPVAQTASDPTCKNHHERIVTVISPTETKYENKYFYDSACTELAKDSVADVTMVSSSSENINKTVTFYNLAGTQLAQRQAQYTITGAPNNFSAVLTSALFIGTSTSPANQYDHQLTVAPQSQYVDTRSANSGFIDNDGRPAINMSFGGSGLLTNGTQTFDPSSGDTTFAGTHTESYVKGSLGSLSLPSSPPFSVQGGTAVGTGTLTGSVAFDSDGNVVSVAVTGTMRNGDNISVTSSGTPPGVSINGTITTSSGNPVATFSVDQFGDGVITFANGQQALIIDWRIVD